MKKLGLLFLFILQLSCNGQKTLKKINGISFVASRDKATQKSIDPILKVNANYAAVMPFGFIRDINSPEIVFNTDRQWFGETKTGVAQYIDLLQKNAIKVMMKPQIWIWRGEFTGTLQMKTEEDWKVLEASYDKFIMTYVALAVENNVAALCIGTELEQFTQQRPQYWKRLIKKIKAVYKGKITYAANWDEYSRVPFWEELDYIGIDAYFPLSEKKTPTVSELRKGWQVHKQKIKVLSDAKRKPVLFTEYGYRSTDYTAKRPWESNRSEIVNLQAQANATEAILEEFWKEDWFAGGFIWKWFIHHQEAGGANNNRFTPQNKSAEKVIRNYYEKR